MSHTVFGHPYVKPANNASKGMSSSSSIPKALGAKKISGGLMSYLKKRKGK